MKESKCKCKMLKRVRKGASIAERTNAECRRLAVDGKAFCSQHATIQGRNPTQTQYEQEQSLYEASLRARLTRP